MPYTVFKADLKHNKEDIISLWKRNFPYISEERYPWIYENNPAGPASCWLLKETRQNKIVGMTAMFPRRIFCEGKPIHAAIAGDFVIDKEHRTLGPALLLQKAALLNGSGKLFSVLYGFPNKNSELVLLRAGYKILGEVHSLTKPLKSYYYLKKHASIPLVTKAFSFLLDFVLKISSKERYFKNKEYELEELISFDQRFDRFWEEVWAQFPMIGERTCSYLNWRYTQSPYKNYQILALIQKRNSAVSGYIVYYIVDNIAHICDLLSLDMNEVLDSLLSGFLFYQGIRGVDAISFSFIGYNTLMEKLREYGFSIRESNNSAIIYPMSDSGVTKDLFDRRHWYLTSGDNDI